MILADDLLEYTLKHKTDFGGAMHAERIEAALLQAQRFVLSPQVQDMVLDLVVRRPRVLLESRRTMFLPAPLTWIEWEHPTARDPVINTVDPLSTGIRRTGFLLIGENLEDLHSGAALIVASVPAAAAKSRPSSRRLGFTPIPGLPCWRSWR